MYEKFTDRARKVMQLANKEAQRFHHEYIGTEHILLGLIAEGTGVAANVLKNLDINLTNVRLEVEKIVLAGPPMDWAGKMPPTPRAKKVIELAIEEARALKTDHIGTEHLLLGLMREAEGVAAQVLMYLGLRLDQVRDETRNLLGFAHDSNGGAPIQSPGAMKSIGLDLEHLPESVRKIVSEFDCQIEILMLDKESAVANQEWKKAAMLRDLGDKLKKLRHEFLAHWPPKWSDLSAE